MIKNIPIRIFKLILSGDQLPEPDQNLLAKDFIKNNFQDKYLAKGQGLEMQIEMQIAERSRLMRLVYPEILQTLAQQNIHLDPPDLLLPLLWQYWLPLAQLLSDRHKQLGRTLIQGLLGGQGTGKTTLGIVLKILLKYQGKTFLSISLDDFYKTYSDRQKLLAHRPDLIWRGPPSTHDLPLAMEIFQKLRDRPANSNNPIAIPRFDKSLHNGAGDRIAPEISAAADIVLFEGWFVGMQPLPISAFTDPIPPIHTDSDRAFAIRCNADLHSYLPLWDYLDSLIILKPEDYRYSLDWRLEAEHKLIATGKTGMSNPEITKFVEYFWKALHPQLFMPHLLSKLAIAPHLSLVIEIGRSHLPTSVYHPISV